MVSLKLKSKKLTPSLTCLFCLASMLAIPLAAKAQVIVQQSTPPVVVVPAQPQPVVVVQQQQPVLYGMEASSYQSLINSLAATFGARKNQRNILVTAIKRTPHGITAAQVKGIIDLMATDKDQLYALKLCAPRIVDRSNSFQILSSFKGEKQIIRARRILDKYN